MKDARTTRRTESNRQLRAQRGFAAVVAQYIHERSGRHSRPARRRLNRGAELRSAAR